MVKYLKMKKMEHDLKYALYSSIFSITNEHKDIIHLVQRLYSVLKDAPIDELHNIFIKELTQIIHDENKKDS